MQYSTLREDLAYMAGIVDGEGTIGLAINPKTGTLKPYLQVANASEDLLRWVTERYGGFLVEATRKTGVHANNPRRYWLWRVYSQQAADVVALIRPFLVVKCRQAWLLLEAWETRNPQFNYGPKVVPPETRALREGFMYAMHTLNAGRGRRGS